jgi:hypothetical protein
LLRKRARGYFEKAGEIIPLGERDDRTNVWEKLPEDLQKEASDISQGLAGFAQVIGPAIGRSPLLTEADRYEAGHAIKGMRAALRFRQFQHWEAQILNDEDRILGVRRAGESDEYEVPLVKAMELFDTWADALQGRLELMNPRSADVSDAFLPATKPISAGHRPNTAFIMMSMAKDQHDLTDVSNTAKRCFERFGIKAYRSDDIEHEDAITPRILDEIKTAEILLADLTGERPNVYYEVGYAHALPRRVILFRKAGSKLHFDLAGYNCPEYKNLTELEEKLMKRLEHVTGRNPSGQPEEKG